MPLPGKYPWEIWFAERDPFHVEAADYEVTKRFLQIQILNEGQRRGQKVSTQTCKRHNDCLVVSMGRASRVNWSAFFHELLMQQKAGRQHAIWVESLKTCTPESFIRRARAQAYDRNLILRVDRKSNPRAIGFTVDFL